MKKNAKVAILDGNEATAYVAFRVNEVCAIYPITPSSPMAEFADEWATKGIKNIWGNIPEIIEMQSEGGAAGAVHGALQTGALTTTFTASQGLMLMLPNMYKIAGELTAAVFHVAARSLAAQALSIFGDHSDVMAARTTGFAMLASSSVQEAHDMALIAQASTLKSKIPFIHFFDGFRTSHEVSKINLISDEAIREMIDDELVHTHRQRALSPAHPVVRGTAQNPDVFFQARETVNPYYDQAPDIVAEAMDRFYKLTGREYQLFNYFGAKDAKKVIVVMASGAETVKETVKKMVADGEKVGVIQVRLYRPFASQAFLEALPKSVSSIAVLDRSKEMGANGEPLYHDVLSTITNGFFNGQLKSLPKIIGGRYGLSSKEFTPPMVKTIYDELDKTKSKNGFTIGIKDDVSNTSLDFDQTSFNLDSGQFNQALFFGLGADGTVGANKNSIKIIGEGTDLHVQAYFVYDSKKSGAQTVSHLRFGKEAIHAPYLIDQADFIACHKFNFVDKVDMLKYAKPNATFLLNAPHEAGKVWDSLPSNVQTEIKEKKIRLYTIDASKVAREAGMGTRINTIMQTCFFAISGVLPKKEAIIQIKAFIEKSYAKKGKSVVEQNFKAVDHSLKNLHEVKIPEKVKSSGKSGHDQFNGAPDFVKNVTAKMMMGMGDELPVSALPNDGTYPTGTTKWEKRNISDFVPEWDPETCIQCGNCSFVCPHSVIRAKFYHDSALKGAPKTFQSAPISAKGFPDTKYTLQIYSEDCTGCTLCVEACPAISYKDRKKKAINMIPVNGSVDQDRKNTKFFENINVNDRSKVDFSSVRGSQFLEPLFEFSGACSGCGETPYVRLMTQLYGDRAVIANATGCSSIYGGNLPTHPWTTNKDGHGPAWSNSLFEDNAEFGLGMRVTSDKHLAVARDLVSQMEKEIGNELSNDLLNAPQQLESEIIRQKERVAELKTKLLKMDSADAKNLLSLADHLVRRCIWIVGGDGWAYDIGSSGLDHALASGKNINVLVLDTEVYSNTGGQMSKATPTAATAKFATGGKKVGKKDLALQAISYGNVYVAQIAMGANPQQTLLAMREAEAYDGPSIILAYSHCIAHGINMQKGLTQQSMAVASGYWPLIRYNPELRKVGKNPFVLDSPRPKIKFKEYAYNELRYKMLTRSNPEEAENLIKLAQELVDLRWQTYEDMASWEAHKFQPVM